MTSPETQKQTLSEPAAWREVARRVDRGDWQWGLCNTLFDLRRDGTIDYQMHLLMGARIRAHKAASQRVKGKWQVWFYPMNRDAAARVLCALMFALEAEDEGGLR